MLDGVSARGQDQVLPPVGAGLGGDDGEAPAALDHGDGAGRGVVGGVDDQPDTSTQTTQGSKTWDAGIKTK